MEEFWIVHDMYSIYMYGTDFGDLKVVGFSTNFDSYNCKDNREAEQRVCIVRVYSTCVQYSTCVSARVSKKTKKKKNLATLTMECDWTRQWPNIYIAKNIICSTVCIFVTINAESTALLQHCDAYVRTQVYILQYSTARVLYRCTVVVYSDGQ